MLILLHSVLIPSALALQHNPTLFRQIVNARLDLLGTVQDTKRLHDFASAAFKALQGCSNASRLSAGQECDAPFPGLRAEPWWDVQRFTWAAQVEAGAEVICKELDEYLLESPADAWSTSITSLCLDTAGFSKLVLQEDGVGSPIGQRYFPHTLDLLRQANVPLSPRPVSINRQGPQTGLAAHSDNMNFLLVCHIGVHVPAGCRFHMKGDGRSRERSYREWVPGKLCIADTSFVHSTTNEHATESRYVLHFSVWHPDLTQIERHGIAEVHHALQTYEASLPQPLQLAE